MRVGVIGGGQLGRMMALAGHPLGISVRCLDPDPKGCPAADVAPVISGRFDDPEALSQLADSCEVVTFETENVPVASARLIAKRSLLRPSVEALAATQDRLLERQLLEGAGVPIARYRSAASPLELGWALQDLGRPAVVKTRLGGYDGRGQAIAEKPNEGLGIWRTLGGGPVIAEERIDFTRELSIVGVRGLSGQVAFYPLVENRHRDGILRLTLSPAPRIAPGLQAKAEAYARAVMEAIDHVGVLTIEFFEVDGDLVANEIAPRVHNSGHWTIEGAACSQFENHLRAITGSPLGSTAPLGLSAMVNVIGRRPDAADVLAVPGASYHWYGKQSRPARKLGHVTIVAADERALAHGVAEVEAALDVPSPAMSR